MINRLCLNCGKTYPQYNTLIKLCPNCASKKWAMKKSYLNKQGKVTKKWLSDRRIWIKENPADHTGYWYCYIGGEALTIDMLQVDHMYSRTRRPDLRGDQNNLAPVCSKHNQEKGSENYD